MGGLKTIKAAVQIGLTAALLTNMSGTSQAAEDALQRANYPDQRAAPLSPRIPELTKTFAYCTGRLSATMEHQWLQPEADDLRTTKAHLETMASLLDATIPKGQGARVLELRIAAKMAQARLLTMAHFDTDETAARAAAAHANTHLERCLALMLR